MSSFVLDGNWCVISPHPYFNPQAFFLSCPAEEGKWQSGFGEHIASSQGQPTILHLTQFYFSSVQSCSFRKHRLLHKIFDFPEENICTSEEEFRFRTPCNQVKGRELFEVHWIMVTALSPFISKISKSKCKFKREMWEKKIYWRSGITFHLIFHMHNSCKFSRDIRCLQFESSDGDIREIFPMW